MHFLFLTKNKHNDDNTYTDNQIFRHDDLLNEKNLNVHYSSCRRVVQVNRDTHV